MNNRRRQMMVNALGGGRPLMGGIKAPITRGTPGMSNPIAFGPPPVTGGTPGAANPIAFGPAPGRPVNMPALGPQSGIAGGNMAGSFQPPAPTLPPIGPGAPGMSNPMAMRPGGNPYVEAQGNGIQPPAIRNPMVRPGVVGGNPGKPAGGAAPPINFIL